jgi:hypothetical protein
MRAGSPVNNILKAPLVTTAPPQVFFRLPVCTLEWKEPNSKKKILRGQDRGVARNSACFSASLGAKVMPGYELQIMDLTSNPTYVNGQAAHYFTNPTARRKMLCAQRRVAAYDCIWTAFMPDALSKHRLCTVIQWGGGTKPTVSKRTNGPTVMAYRRRMGASPSNALHGDPASNQLKKCLIEIYKNIFH